MLVTDVASDRGSGAMRRGVSASEQEVHVARHCSPIDTFVYEPGGVAVRMNWKKRLAVCSALTLLVLMMVPMLTAGAQVVTAELDVQVNVINGSAGTAQRS